MLISAGYLGPPTSKNEALNIEDENEVSDPQTQAEFVEKALAFVRALRERGNPDGGQEVDKDFIDWLYSDD